MGMDNMDWTNYLSCKSHDENSKQTLLFSSVYNKFCFNPPTEIKIIHDVEVPEKKYRYTLFCIFYPGYTAGIIKVIDNYLDILSNLDIYFISKSFEQSDDPTGIIKPKFGYLLKSKCKYHFNGISSGYVKELRDLIFNNLVELENQENLSLEELYEKYEKSQSINHKKESI